MIVETKKHREFYWKILNIKEMIDLEQTIMHFVNVNKNGIKWHVKLGIQNIVKDLRGATTWKVRVQKKLGGGMKICMRKRNLNKNVLEE